MSERTAEEIEQIRRYGLHADGRPGSPEDLPSDRWMPHYMRPDAPPLSETELVVVRREDVPGR